LLSTPDGGFRWDQQRQVVLDKGDRAMMWKPLLAGATLLATGVGALAFWWPFGSRDAALRLPGTVETQEVHLGSKTGGRVAEVLVREGDLINPGQPLVRLEAPELEAQREQWGARLRAAEADLEKARNGARPEEKEAAREAVAAAEARWRRLRKGPRDEEVRQAEADLDAAEAELKLARQKLERTSRLVPVAAVTQEEYEAAAAALAHLQAQARAARARLDLLHAGTRPEEIDEAAAELKRARAQLDLVTTATRSEDLAAAEARAGEARGKLKEVEANLEEALVRAPEQAVVEVLAVRRGDLVAPNQPLLRVLRADDLWVRVYVPETQLGRVQVGQEVEVRVDGYPEWRFAGKVAQIAGVSEFTPRNVQSAEERRHQLFGVKVRVADPEGVFKSGMAAEVVLSPPA
jgi:multidrug resistance efflux pump